MPAFITLRFYSALNDFLAASLRHKEIAHQLHQARSVKDLIESYGVPHTEIELILVNGEAVSFNYIVCESAYISVYPPFNYLDVSLLSQCRPAPLITPRFVLDVHLGQLARYLRLLGFDTLYDNHYKDEELAEISSREQRILLTYDRQLLMRKIITHGYYVRSRQPRVQLTEIISRFNLLGRLQPFSRCLHCNGKILKINTAEISASIPENTSKYYNVFYQCASCQKIYWKGSHYFKLKKLIDNVSNQGSYAV